MTKYIYKVSSSRNSNYISESELYHFEFPKFPKIEFPKIQAPKIELPKINLPKVELPKVDVAGIAKSVGIGNSSDKDRMWKDHKWIARKRDKNGKWIYDYGNGFPGETKFGGDKITNINPDKDIKLYKPSMADKLIAPLTGLGKFLSSTDPQEMIQGGKEFIGGFSEMFKTLKANQLKAGAKEDSTGLKRKNKDRGKDYDLQNANPGFDNKDGGSQHNCPCCSVAYDMRRRGYEVTAKESRVGLSSEQIASFYKNPKVHEVTSDKSVNITPNMTTDQYVKESSKNLTKAVEQQFDTEPNNTRGMAYVEWNVGGGHIFCYEKENGKTTFYDAQSGEKVSVSDYVDQSTSFNYFRTDNLEPDYDQIKKVVD